MKILNQDSSSRPICSSLLPNPIPYSNKALFARSKWDQSTLTALYLLVLPLTRSIHSLRSLRPTQLELLRKIRKETERVAREKWGLERGQLRMFVHYQPTYCECHSLTGIDAMVLIRAWGVDHFHVHVVSLYVSSHPRNQSLTDRMPIRMSRLTFTTSVFPEFQPVNRISWMILSILWN